VISVFEYVQAEKAPLYRAIMCVFVASKQRFVVHLRQRDVINGMAGISELPDHSEIESALAQLCEWGNLQTRPDTSNVCTVEDFYNPRHIFHMTSQGEAAEAALAIYNSNCERRHPLQYSGLADIRLVIQELKQLSPQAERNAGPIHRHMLLLFALVEDLSATAQTFIDKLEGRLDGRTDVQPSDVRRLIEYCRRFIGDLELEADTIAELVRDIESAGLERLILVVVRRSIDERKDATPKTVAEYLGEWRLRWERLRSWFISLPNLQSHSVRLRERVRASLPALLRMSGGISVQGVPRIDRIADFRILARWFAEAGTDAEAHALWRAAFGLCPARHLTINDATLGEREAQDVPANTSWLDAPPLRIRPEDYRGSARTNGLSRIVDRSAEKEKLAVATHDEAMRLLTAQQRFGTGNRIRLSELEHLEIDEFELFLDLLGEAVSARVSAADPVEILSGDGCLKVRLEPTGDHRQALISTGDGMFSGPDQWISIEQIVSQDLPEAVV
jgi:uncharacterized protein (TIGR02677 family)